VFCHYVVDLQSNVSNFDLTATHKGNQATPGNESGEVAGTKCPPIKIEEREQMSTSRGVGRRLPKNMVIIALQTCNVVVTCEYTMQKLIVKSAYK